MRPRVRSGVELRDEPASAGACRSTLVRLLVYGVVSARTHEALELFIRREDAERFVAEVREDEPELAELLSVEKIQLGD